MLDLDDAIKRLKAEYPKGVELRYVDYRDCIENADDMEELIKTWYIEDIDRYWEDWEYETILYCIKEVFNDEEVEEIRNNDELESPIRDWFYDNDTSDVIKWLLRNTNKQLMFYDLWLEVEECDSWEEIDNQVKEIMEHLHLWVEHTEKIRGVVADAYYWWQLCVLFDWDLQDFYGEKTEKYFCFKNLTLWIIHRGNGSWNFEKTKIDLCVPFDRKNFYIDKAHKYSVSEIFWINTVDDDTWYYSDVVPDKFIFLDMPTSEWPTQLDKDKEKEKFFDDEYRKWICHYEDTKFSRHTTVYINDFPCWYKCKKCWRFFID